MPETAAPPTPAETKAPASTPREFHAAVRHARISARKARYVTELLKDCSVTQAKHRLAYTDKRGARFVNRLLNSVLANVAHLQQEKDLEVDVQNLWIRRIWVDPGKIFRRYTPAPQGRAVPIRKRFCHIHVIVAEGAAPASGGARARRVQASRKAAAAAQPKE